MRQREIAQQDIPSLTRRVTSGKLFRHIPDLDCSASSEDSHATTLGRYRTNRTRSMHAAVDAGVGLKPKNGRPGIQSERALALYQVRPQIPQDTSSRQNHER